MEQLSFSNDSESRRSICPKRAFGINGLVTKEEMDGGEVKDDINISSDQAKVLFLIAEKNQEIVRQVLDEFGFEGSRDITKFMYENVCNRIKQLVDAATDMSNVIEEEDIETDEIQDNSFDYKTDIEDLPWNERQKTIRLGEYIPWSP